MFRLVELYCIDAHKVCPSLSETIFAVASFDEDISAIEPEQSEEAEPDRASNGDTKTDGN